MNRKKATLPELPKGKEFEEFLAAFFQSNGYYVERSIIDRQEEEVLELDFLATRYADGEIPKICLYEVKGGKWGFPDIFKLKGWLFYLNIDNAVLLVSKPVQNIDFYHKISEILNIEIIVIDDLEKTPFYLKRFIAPDEITQPEISIWRYSYWMERQFINYLINKKKSNRQMICYEALSKYYYLINSGTFFTKNIIERAEKLYQAYRDYCHISAKTAHELKGEDFNGDHKLIPSDIFKETFYNCKMTDLAVSAFIEHRARLSILKAAVDFQIYKNLGVDHNKEWSIKFGDLNLEYSLLDMLPNSFKEGLEKISKDDYFYLYPIFWQWFVYVYGGFILNDYKDHEYSCLSSQTGIPVSDISKALAAYDKLFPKDGGWFVQDQNANITLLSIFPMPFMGIGAFYRRMVYTDDMNIHSLNLTGKYAAKDLAKWNNLGLQVLNMF